MYLELLYADVALLTISSCVLQRNSEPEEAAPTSLAVTSLAVETATAEEATVEEEEDMAEEDTEEETATVEVEVTEEDAIATTTAVVEDTIPVAMEEDTPFL